jgi:hypothetical protein
MSNNLDLTKQASPMITDGSKNEVRAPSPREGWSSALLRNMPDSKTFLDDFLSGNIFTPDQNKRRQVDIKRGNEGRSIIKQIDRAANDVRALKDRMSAIAKEDSERSTYRKIKDYFSRDIDAARLGTQTQFGKHLSTAGKYIGDMGKSYYSTLTDDLGEDATEEQKRRQLLTRIATGVGLGGLGLGLYNAFTDTPEQKFQAKVDQMLTPEERELRALGYGAPHVPQITPEMIKEKEEQEALLKTSMEATRPDLETFKGRNRFRNYIDEQHIAGSILTPLLFGGLTAAKAKAIDRRNEGLALPAGLIAAGISAPIAYGSGLYDNWDQQETLGLNDKKELDRLLETEAKLIKALEARGASKTASQADAYADAVPTGVEGAPLALYADLKNPANRARYLKGLNRAKIEAALTLGTAGGVLTGGFAALGKDNVRDMLTAGLTKGALGALIGGGLGYGIGALGTGMQKRLHGFDETKEEDLLALEAERADIRAQEDDARDRIAKLRARLQAAKTASKKKV